jgi:hypothetical protein
MRQARRELRTLSQVFPGSLEFGGNGLAPSCGQRGFRGFIGPWRKTEARSPLTAGLLTFLLLAGPSHGTERVWRCRDRGLGSGTVLLPGLPVHGKRASRRLYGRRRYRVNGPGRSLEGAARLPRRRQPEGGARRPRTGGRRRLGASSPMTSAGGGDLLRVRHPLLRGLRPRARRGRRRALGGTYLAWAWAWAAGPARGGGEARGDGLVLCALPNGSGNRCLNRRPRTGVPLGYGAVLGVWRGDLGPCRLLPGSAPDGWRRGMSAAWRRGVRPLDGLRSDDGCGGFGGSVIGWRGERGKGGLKGEASLFRAEGLPGK